MGRTLARARSWSPEAARTLSGVGRSTGFVVILAGLGVVVVGVLIWSGALSWFGRLPGDVRHETDSARVFIPITSMIVVSVVLTIVVNLVARFLR